VIRWSGIDGKIVSIGATYKENLPVNGHGHYT